MELHLLIENEKLSQIVPGMFEFHGQKTDIIDSGTYFSVTPEDLYLLDGAALCRWSELSLGETTLDHLDRVLMCRDRSVQLSDREYGVMRLLMQRPDRCVAKKTIFHRVWGYDSEATENSVEVYIRFLRRKLCQIDSDLQIETVRWYGYRVSKLKNP